jgi:hypothetical protein
MTIPVIVGEHGPEEIERPWRAARIAATDICPGDVIRKIRHREQGTRAEWRKPVVRVVPSRATDFIAVTFADGHSYGWHKDAQVIIRIDRPPATIECAP